MESGQINKSVYFFTKYWATSSRKIMNTSWDQQFWCWWTNQKKYLIAMIQLWLCTTNLMILIIIIILMFEYSDQTWKAAPTETGEYWNYFTDKNAFIQGFKDFCNYIGLKIYILLVIKCLIIDFSDNGLKI